MKRSICTMLFLVCLSRSGFGDIALDAGTLDYIVTKGKFMATAEVFRIERWKEGGGAEPEWIVERDSVRVQKVFRGSTVAPSIRITRRGSISRSPRLPMVPDVGSVIVIASAMTDTVGAEVVEDSFLFTAEPFGRNPSEETFLSGLIEAQGQPSLAERHTRLLSMALDQWNSDFVRVAAQCARILGVLSQELDETECRRILLPAATRTLLQILQAPQEDPDPRRRIGCQTAAVHILATLRYAEAENTVRDLMNHALRNFGAQRHYGEGLRYLARIGAANASTMIRAALAHDFPIACSGEAFAALAEIDRPVAGEEALGILKEFVAERRPGPSGIDKLCEVLRKWNVSPSATLVIDGAILYYWSPRTAIDAYLALVDHPDIGSMRRLLDIRNTSDAQAVCEAILNIGGIEGQKLVEDVSRNHSDEFVRIAATNAISLRHAQHEHDSEK